MKEGGGGGSKEKKSKQTKQKQIVAYFFSFFIVALHVYYCTAVKKQLVLAKILMNRYQITGNIYIHIGMNE